MSPQNLQIEASSRCVSPIATGSHGANTAAPLENTPQGSDYDAIQLGLQVVRAMYGSQAVDLQVPVPENWESEDGSEVGSSSDYDCEEEYEEEDGDEDKDGDEDEEMVVHFAFTDRPPSSGSETTSGSSVQADEKDFKPQDERRSLSVPAYGLRPHSFEVGIDTELQVKILEDVFSETMSCAAINGGDEENIGAWLGEDISIQDVERKTARLDPRLVEHQNVLPPHVFRRMKERALAIVDFGILKGLRLSFQPFQVIHSGNGTSIIEIVRSVGSTEHGFGHPENSVWVMKRFRNLAGKLRKDTKNQLRTECEAYQRIAESPRQGKLGFSFLMMLEASITTEYEVGLVMSLMPSNLEVLLSKTMSESKMMLRSDTRRIMAQMCIAVATLHSIGIIHSDLKPSNVLLDARGNVKLADFGMSYVAKDLRPLERNGGYTVACGGTEGYTAPEKLSFWEGHSYEVDYWSLGCVFFEMVTGKDRDALALSSLGDLRDWERLFVEPCQRREYLQEVSEVENDDAALPVLCGLLDPNPLKRMGIDDLLREDFFEDDFTTRVMKENTLKGVHVPEDQSAEADLEDLLIPSGPTVYCSFPANDSLYCWINPCGCCVPPSAR